MILSPIWLVLVVMMCQVYGMSELIKELVTPIKGLGEACGYASCTTPLPGSLNVHIVPHTHGELGQTQTFYSYYTGHDDVYEPTTLNMKQILDYTISELWASSMRKFTFSDMPYFFYWWAHRDGTVRRMVYELLRQGRLNFVGGGWSMSDEATTSYHAIIDHFTYSLRKINSSFLECGRPLVAWQIDAVGHSREFASLMAQMGYDALFISPIGYDEEIERIQRKEMEFLWRGNDDIGPESDIFSHVPFDGMVPPPGFCFSSYCTDPLIISSTYTFHNIHERVTEFIESMKHRQAPYYSTKNVMVLMGGRMAYSDASMWFENIDKLIQYVNMVNANSSVYAFYSTPGCYLKAVYDESPVLRTKQDDFFPQAMDMTSYAAGGYTSRPSMKYLARMGHKYMQISKQLHVTAGLGDYGQFFEDFQWINGVFQDHHVITGEARLHVRQFYVRRMATQMQQAVVKLMKDAFKTKRSRVGPEFVVEALVAATMPVPSMVMDMPGRNSILDMELIFIARDIPPLGYRSYYYRRRDLGWERPKRSLIKKINQKKPKKYLVRQTNTSPDDDTLFAEPEYEYFEDIGTTPGTPQYETRILFGNVSRNDNESVYSDVLTPKSRTAHTTTEMTSTVTTSTDSSTTAETTSVTDFEEPGNLTTVPATSTTTQPPITPSTPPPITPSTTSTTTPTPPTRTTTKRAPKPSTTQRLPQATIDDLQFDPDENATWMGYAHYPSNRTYIRNRKSDAVLSGVKTVDLNNLFRNLQFHDVKEMTLAANMPLKDWTPLDWRKMLFFKNFNDAYGNGTEEFSEDTVKGLEDVELGKPVILAPQQIRTFLLTYTYDNDEKST